MDNELFFNGGHTPSSSTAFESTSMIRVWHQLAPPSDFSPEKSLDSIFDPFSSVVPSPKASNSHVSGEGLKIREKLGEFPSYDTTPLSSPPKLHSPIMAVNSNVAGFSGDPGLAERAAMFSCFGSKSFNGRTSQFSSYRYTPPMADGKLSRVSRSPSLNAFGSNSSLESMVSDQISEELTCRKRKANAKGKPKEPILFDENSNGKRNKVSEEKRYENGGGKTEEEDDGKSCRSKEKTSKTKINSKPPEPPKDYIHVRARRGQATDSHSLAERVRREKISERMKLLQDLVPGCNKVTGKALMLDEIIKYVQSLQRQVEFLSMKLAFVNTRTESAMDFLISKEVFESNNSLSGTLFGNDSSPSSIYGHQTFCLQLPLINEISENFSQYPMFGEDNLQSIVHVGIDQSQTTELVASKFPLSVPGMEIELRSSSSSKSSCCIYTRESTVSLVGQMLSEKFYI